MIVEVSKQARQWRRWQRLTLLVVIGIGALAVVALLVWLVPTELYGYVKEPKDRATAEASTRTGLIAGLAGLAALGGLVLTARNVQINRQTLEATQQAQNETLRLTEQGHITERYTKAIEQLGNKDSLDVRLGGIYALERIAVDSIRDHPTVVEVLSAFIREHSRPTTNRMLLPIERFRMQAAELPMARARQDRAATPKPATDVQAAVSVLGRLPSRPGVSRGDLTSAHLTGARLGGATLTGADLDRATLAGAWLDRANLRGTDLGGATLTGAYLGGATLTGAWLDRANLRGTNLATAKNLTQQQLDRAQGDEDTKLPDGLQRPAHWSAAGGIASGPAAE